MTRNTCPTCRYWKHLVQHSGTCRRYPPQPREVVVNGNDWCGEWQEKPQQPQRTSEIVPFTPPDSRVWP